MPRKMRTRKRAEFESITEISVRSEMPSFVSKKTESRADPKLGRNFSNSVLSKFALGRFSAVWKFGFSQRPNA